MKRRSGLSTNTSLARLANVPVGAIRLIRGPGTSRIGSPHSKAGSGRVSFVARRALRRTTRRLSLTESGPAYLRAGPAHPRRRRRGRGGGAPAAERAQGHLEGGGPEVVRAHSSVAAVANFLVTHRQLEIELDLNDRRVDLVSEGYDLAIRIGKLPDSSLIARRLAPCRHVACASPVYLQERGEQRSPQELEGDRLDCLVYSNRTIS